MGKEKCVSGKEKGAKEREKVKYFGTKFECYEVIYFGTEGVSLAKLILQHKNNMYPAPHVMT